MNSVDYKLFFEAIQKNDLQYIKQFFLNQEKNSQFNIESTQGFGWSPFVCASYYGHFEIVKYLLISPDIPKKANVNALSSNGTNAIMYVCYRDNIDFLDYLLCSEDIKPLLKISLYDKNYEQDNAFIFACRGKAFNIVEYLLLEHNFQIDNHTMNWLKNNNLQDIIQMINARDLHHQLQDKMDEKSQVQRKKI